jgi:hypothetical protein
LCIKISFKKEGKTLIYSTITFSSSSEESVPLFSGEYPDITSGGGGGLFKQPPNSVNLKSIVVFQWPQRILG